MATSPTQSTWDPLALATQLQNIAEKSQQLVQAFLLEQPDATRLGMVLIPGEAAHQNEMMSPTETG